MQERLHAHATGSAQSHDSLRHLRRLLTGETAQDIADQVSDSIKNSMQNGDFNDVNPNVVNVSWVPVEDLDEESRDIDPVSDDDDGGFDPLWLVVVLFGLASVLGVIMVAIIWNRRNRSVKIMRETQAQDKDMDADKDTNDDLDGETDSDHADVPSKERVAGDRASSSRLGSFEVHHLPKSDDESSDEEEIIEEEEISYHEEGEDDDQGQNDEKYATESIGPHPVEP